MIGKLLPVLSGAISKSRVVATKAAQKLGTSATPSAILAAAKENPVTTALILYEMGELTYAQIEELKKQYPDVAATLGLVDDKIGETISIAKIADYKDELETIDFGIRLTGSFNNLKKLMRLIQLDSKFFELWDQLKQVGRNR